MTAKKHKHIFIVEVTTTGSIKSAKLAILSAFARRQPDGCEFRTMVHGDYLRRILRTVFQRET